MSKLIWQACGYVTLILAGGLIHNAWQKPPGTCRTITVAGKVPAKTVAELAMCREKLDRTRTALGGASEQLDIVADAAARGGCFVEAGR